MDHFFGFQKSTFNLGNKKCILQGDFFVYHVTGSTYITYLLFLSYVYLKDKNVKDKTLKGIEKIQFVSESTILLNLQISKFHGSICKQKN